MTEPITDAEFPDLGKAKDAPIHGNGADPFEQDAAKANGHDKTNGAGTNRVSFTSFRAHGARLSKQYMLDKASGGIRANGGTRFAIGEYEVITFDASDPPAALTAIGAVIDKLPSYAAIGLGVPLDGSVKGDVTTKDRRTKGNKALARTLDCFGWPSSCGLLLLDGDDFDGLFDVLCELHPPFRDVAFLVRPSASASVVDPQTGERYKTGEHCYVLIDDPSQSKACLEALLKVAWCCGKGKSGGFLKLTKAGHVLTYGPIDKTVGSPERLSYEGVALVGKGLSTLPRLSTVIGGNGVLCAAELIAFAEQHAPEALFNERVSEAENDPEFIRKRDEVRAAFRETHVRATVARGVPRAKAEKSYDEAVAAGKRTIGARTFFPLTDEHVLFWPNGLSFTVADIKADPKAFHKKECCDPIEGTSYKTRNPGFILTDGPEIVIYSRAHGDAFAYVAPKEEIDWADLFARIGSPGWKPGKEKKKSNDDPETFDDLPPDLKKIIASPPFPGEDRNKTASSAIFKLFIRGWTDEAIEALFKAHPDGIGAEFKDGAKDLHAEIERLRQRFSESDDAKRNDIITNINARHALVLAGNKAAVMKFDGATKFRLLQVDSFKLWFANETVQVGNKLKGAGEYWLGHSKRRQYEGIEFEPAGGRRGFYNLWQGFTVQPRKGDCSKFLTHIWDNVAQGDEDTYNWIVGWWAQIFQQPALKMETALVLRGGFGAGKTKIGEVMGSLIDQHYLIVASPRYITGQFNSHMASLLVLHADEAFWAGDKKSEGTLKDLVSGKSHMLEYKNVDPIAIKNFIRLFVSGNPEWLIPAGFKDRRWAIFDIGEAQMQNNAYFAAIDHEMDNGGREALLHYLLNFDLKQINLRVVPKTAALLDQQIQSMDPEQSWWMDTLMNGVLPKPSRCNEHGLCLKEGLHGRYVHHAKQQGAAFRSSQVKLGIFLTKQIGSELKTTRATVGYDRPWCYRLPSLKKCREKFAAALGRPVDWGPGWEADSWRYEEWNIGSTDPD